MLLPGTRVPPGAQVSTAGPARAVAERSGAVAAQGLPRTPPRTGAGRSSLGAGVTGSTSQISPGNVWSTSTPMAASSSFTAPRTPPGATSPSTLRTPTAVASATADPATPPYTGSAASQSAIPRSAVNAAAPQRRPARKSATERPAGVRGGIRAGIPNSTGAHGNCQASSSGAGYPVPLRSVGRGAASGSSGRTSGGGSGQVSASSKALSSTSAAGYAHRGVAETPASTRRCARSLSPPQADSAPAAPQRPQPPGERKWVSEDVSTEQAVLHDTSLSRVSRSLDLSSETSRVSSPLSPLNERRQIQSAATKVQSHYKEYGDAAPAELRPPTKDESPSLRPQLYHNYPTLGLDM